MCGRLACTLCPDDIVNSIHKSTKKDESKPSDSKPEWIERQYVYEPIFNAAPTTVLPVMVHKTSLGLKTNEKSADSVVENSDYCIIPMRWSMVIPNRPETSTFHTHNARIENVLNSGLYKPCLLSGKRCVILADGYYEWKTTEGKDRKEPFYLYFKSTDDNIQEKNLVKFAGLFNTIQDESGIKHTCSMLTKESTSSLKWLHHRMPIFLNTPEDIHNWLYSKEVKHDEALKLLPDYEQVGQEFKLEYYQVDKSYVNNSSCNSEKCLERISLKRKSVNTLDGWLAKKKK